MNNLKSISPAASLNQIPTSYAVPAMLQCVYENLNELEQSLETLKSRLHPVLESEQDTEGAGKYASDSAARNVPHAEQLEAVASRLRQLNYRTLDAINRLHV